MGRVTSPTVILSIVNPHHHFIHFFLQGLTWDSLKFLDSRNPPPAPQTQVSGHGPRGLPCLLSPITAPASVPKCQTVSLVFGMPSCLSSLYQKNIRATPVPLLFPKLPFLPPDNCYLITTQGCKNCLTINHNHVTTTWGIF